VLECYRRMEVKARKAIDRELATLAALAVKKPG
jgi:hypothetical protein